MNGAWHCLQSNGDARTNASGAPHGVVRGQVVTAGGSCTPHLTPNTASFELTGDCLRPREEIRSPGSAAGGTAAPKLVPLRSPDSLPAIGAACAQHRRPGQRPQPATMLPPSWVEDLATPIVHPGGAVRGP